jgi:hypothetical protein
MADPTELARQIAQRLAASMGGAATAPPAWAPPGADAAAMDPAARARAIAAKLAANVRGGGSVLGKRSAEDAFGGGTEKRKKIVLPEEGGMNYMGILIGPRVRASCAPTQGGNAR